jgi:hypothetical protein
MECKHPEIEVELIGNDGNAFAVMGAVSKALRRGGYSDEVEQFQSEAMSGDYNHLLQVVMQWVTVADEEEVEDDWNDDEEYDDDWDDDNLDDEDESE